jgi:hypothetical protein
MNVQVFLQSELLRDVEAVELDAKAGYEALLRACLAKIGHDGAGMALFVEDDDDEGAAEQLKHIPDGLRVHLHRQKAIEVTVRYAGRQARRDFQPATTIARVKRWATHELGINASDAAELMLQVSGTDIRPDADVHLGSLVVTPHRSVTFDLVPSPRVNG